MKKSSVYAIVFVSISIGFLFCFFASFYSFAGAGPLSGLGVIASMVLIIEILPVFALLYLAAVLILRKYYKQKKSIAGNIFLFLALIIDSSLWHEWGKDWDENISSSWVFIPPIALAVSIWLFISLPSFFPAETFKSNL